MVYCFMWAGAATLDLGRKSREQRTGVNELTQCPQFWTIAVGQGLRHDWPTGRQDQEFESRPRCLGSGD
jgi:hypothetical protein